MGSLTIAYRSNTRHHWCTETHVAASFESLGHTVVRLQEDEVPWPAVEEAALDADLFLWTRTWASDPAGGHRTLANLRAAGVPTVSFHLDRYIGLDREAQIPDDPFWRTDLVFTADGGHDEAFASYGVTHRWLPPAIHEPECVLGQPDRRFPHPVVFVGSHPYPHPEWRPYRTQLLGALRARYGRRFRIWPRGRQPIRGRDLANLYASAAVIVGDSCLAPDRHTAGQPLTRYASDRIPETLGRGGFLIHPRVEGITDGSCWTEGAHLACYNLGDFTGLGDLIDHYLTHPDERAVIAAAGRAHTLAHHTYAIRVGQVLAALVDSGLLRPVDA